MRYVTAEDFFSFYGEIVPRVELERLAFEAERFVDAHTTGIDNVKKLKTAFPKDEEDAETVKRCVCKLIKTLNDIETAQTASGYTKNEDGTVTGKIVSSVSSGTESISYSSGGTGASSIASAAGSEEQKKILLTGIVREYLSGVADSNGVNLLYMGRYPYVS